MKCFLRLLFSLLLLHGAVSRSLAVTYPPLQITEFMASNKSTLQDQDGDYSDWIEIFNPTAQEVSLAGWRLSTSATNSAQWIFPGYVMMPGDYLVVFASAKNRAVVTAELHTNFKLASGGGFLGLFNPTGASVFSFAAYPAQSKDVSYGCDPIQPAITGFFTVPTPGNPNVSQGTGFAPQVTFSPPGGAYTTSASAFSTAHPMPVSLTTTNPAAVIRYTLDGSLPHDASPVYAAPLQLKANTRVTARAFAPGLMPGQVHSETYLQMTPALASVRSTMPAMVIYDFGIGSIPDAVGSPQNYVNFAVYEPANGITSLTNPPTLNTGAGINVRGSSTRGNAKQAWDVQFWDDLTNNVDYSPLGLPADSDWALYAPDNFEPVLIHNPLIYQLSNETGRYAPRTRMVEVYLNTTGQALSPSDYFGIYVLEEKITRGPNRIPVNKLQPTDNTPPAVTGGYMLKIDRTGPGESGLNAAGQTIVYNGPSEFEILTPERAPQQAYIANYMNSFGSALTSSNFRNPVTGYAKYIDVGSAIDHHILNVVSFNVDALRLSAYFYKPRSGPIVFGPIWDFDRSQGSTDGRDFNPEIWRSPVSDYGTDYFNYSWWGSMFTDIDFWQKWVDRYQVLRTGTLSTNHIYADIDALVAQVRSEQPREASRWSGYTTPRSGNVTISGYSYNFPGTYQGEVNFLKKWYADRLHFIDTNFLAQPVLSVPGGNFTPGTTLSLSGPVSATIYYTLDGSDPRLSGGAVSASALLYSAPIPLSVGLMVQARSFSATHRNLTGLNKPPLSTPWSGVASATYGVVTTPGQIAYATDGATYSQNFDSLPAPGATTIDAANPVTIAGVIYPLANPFGFAAPVTNPGSLGGLGLTNTMPGWFGMGGSAARLGASAGDQSGGGVISFGPLSAGSTNRALGLIATGGSGSTAFGVCFVNATGHNLNLITLGFTAELWRQTAVAKTLVCSYYIDPSATNGFPTNATGILTNLTVKFPPLPGGSPEAALDGTLSTNQQSLSTISQPIADWPPGGTLWLVWSMGDTTSKGQGLALDNVSFSATAGPPPPLGVQLSGGILTLFWPAFPDGFTLQTTPALSGTNGWSTVNQAAASTNGTNTISLPLGAAIEFFRLANTNQ